MYLPSGWLYILDSHKTAIKIVSVTNLKKCVYVSMSKWIWHENDIKYDCLIAWSESDVNECDECLLVSVYY